MVAADIWVTTHVVGAIAALLTGLIVLVSPKGTMLHRVMGSLYGVTLLLVNAAALSLHREATFGVFHLLALASLAILAAGLVPMLTGRRSRKVIARHATFMSWSYAGLVAAGVGQGTGALTSDSWAVAIPVSILTVLGGAAVVITARVPTALSRVRPTAT